MYFGTSGGRSGKTDQSQSHIRDYNQDYNSRHSAAPPPPPDPRQKVKAFERQMVYDQHVKLGKTPQEAARLVGSNVPFGVSMTPNDIKQIIDTGKLQKEKVVVFIKHNIDSCFIFSS